MTMTIEYHCPSHGTIRETVTEGQRNSAIRYGFDCCHCGTTVTATDVTTPAMVTIT
jgi:uncharacterized Zn finger protein